MDIGTLKLFCDVVRLKGFTQAAAGNYQAEITALTHDIDFWENTLDLENPETFTK